MARRSKWVEVKSANEPLVDVAQRTLSDRLRLVWRYLRRSHDSSPSDTENVHQLRVATRRTVAAMDVFSDLLPRRRGKWMGKQLKTIRQAAGDARDLDVMLGRFRSLAEDADDGPYTEFVHRLKVQRERAQDPIDTEYEKLCDKNFERRIKKLVKRLKLRDKAERAKPLTFCDAATSRLTEVAQQFIDAGHADFSTYPPLHQFRIEGKRLRYAMEIFAAAFPPEFREDLYPRIAALQERLGEVGDHATAYEQFSHWLQEEDLDDDLRQMLTELAAEEQEQVDTKRQEFVAWWKGEKQAELAERLATALNAPQLAEETALALRRAE